MLASHCCRGCTRCGTAIPLPSSAAPTTYLPVSPPRQVARGRITFVIVRFEPRPKVAPWLVAAMRLAPLLDFDGRTVVTLDIHDDAHLQNAQVHELGAACMHA